MKNFFAKGVSKDKSIRFNKRRYLLHFDNSHPRLITGEELVFGYLGKGKEKGWFKAPLSKDRSSFFESWDMCEIYVTNPDKEVWDSAYDVIEKLKTLI
jgi:hypothetical protein